MTGDIRFLRLCGVFHSDNPVEKSTLFLVSHDKVAGVMVENGPVVATGDMVRLSWSPEAILPIEPHDSYNINVMLREYDQESGEWIDTELAKEMPNSGSIEIAVPERAPKNDNESAAPAVFQIEVSESSTDTQIQKRGLFSAIAKAVKKAVKFVTKVVSVVLSLVLEPARRLLCEAWGLIESRERSQQILSELPPCPCTVAEIDTRGDGFELEDRSISSIFHPGSDKCFRQRRP